VARLERVSGFARQLGAEAVFLDSAGSLERVFDAPFPFRVAADRAEGRPFVAEADLQLDELPGLGKGSALDLAARLTDIDPTSLRDEHGFWAGLVFDVGLGDYSDL